MGDETGKRGDYMGRDKKPSIDQWEECSDCRTPLGVALEPEIVKTNSDGVSWRYDKTLWKANCAFCRVAGDQKEDAQKQTAAMLNLLWMELNKP